MSAVIAYRTVNGDWVVEKCEPDNDGICHKAIFCGPFAKAHARSHLRRLAVWAWLKKLLNML